MWDREHIEFIHFEDAPWQPLEVAGLEPGLEIRILSVDPNDGALSGILRVPPGWRHDREFFSHAPEQLFVLSGDLHKGGYDYTEQCYAYRPAGAPHGPMWSETGCETIVMWDRVFDLQPGTAPEPAGMIGKIDTIEMYWERTVAEGPAAGIKVKRLREAPETGEMTFICGIMPNWKEPRREHHPCVEESFKIFGDMNLNMDLGDRMVMTENCYFYRPPYIKHGPLFTKRGTMSLVRVSSTLINRYMDLEEDEEYLALKASAETLTARHLVD